ncbi:methylmalonyl Co-A mutase-associated GTPase MeaB [Haematobacter missouriensis]|uniref:Methylmalonyl Co-A mutase-associated GTPase MeaB n=1 Tax=Haematobacter missouriensis TaxID=366616 RepID=A0A225CPS5_9RHOB|nr:methylmalonyl Co-A mutase-associated GTPase MeaB [Haematobacter missouriensis]OWJ73934.1 methylmalonyl Co-A mutase-associated GTPase MeaB [Haematobacter missouriensis]OWJ83530.1 methylmalonyl Co-A mutase-associated GTPase MeaB [Haematobacter missouriensis]
MTVQRTSARRGPVGAGEISMLATGVLSGDRRALARAITLVESQRADHRLLAEDLLDRLAGSGRQALRLGLSGTPGVGKSTFIESFGLRLTENGKRIAVLAVDPSSARTGGSILGDKTRMELLSRDPNAFIRPSPSRSELGGVARRTREAVALCEAAGFDVVLVETVGVGQSETMVAEMTDIFVLLLAPAGGDELQGVKRGIMEIADLILVNKADGDLKAAATRTCADYAGALRLLRKRPQDPPGYPKALTVSALEQAGLAEAWEEIGELARWRQETGWWTEHRATQARRWFEEEVRLGLIARLSADPAVRAELLALGQAVMEGRAAPARAARDLIDRLSRPPA